MRLQFSWITGDTVIYTWRYKLTHPKLMYWICVFCFRILFLYSLLQYFNSFLDYANCTHHLNFPTQNNTAIVLNALPRDTLYIKKCMNPELYAINDTQNDNVTCQPSKYNFRTTLENIRSSVFGGGFVSVCYK